MDTFKEVVQQRYGEAALRARSGVKSGCGCGTSACCDADPITSNLYDESQAAAIPAEALLGVARVRKSDGIGGIKAR
jgi:hypothetical protein